MNSGEMMRNRTIMMSGILAATRIRIHPLRRRLCWQSKKNTAAAVTRIMRGYPARHERAVPLKSSVANRNSMPSNYSSRASNTKVRSSERPNSTSRNNADSWSYRKALLPFLSLLPFLLVSRISLTHQRQRRSA
jgi:hypothetical protein